ncbi:hypothetical protein SeMB42_g07438 [Synchytrium endobioticum]|uniref:U2 small nuclear ribonucleoprotein A' n=1 Tax=Synchytrium endobioticum TaxID=286115 RepID=A0A507C2M1_9FUNG|nr:hypothetical protein SeMB42_g07438 [Synchytrium endobioticum]TPX39945.1 hypothetical protein SeLEV6574_g06907 [Synchytrium endobioticum]
MVKLDYNVLSIATSARNPVGDWELDLRGLRIPRIENLAITRDQHDSIDLTDNDIRRLENLPCFIRLKHLHLSNNRITRIEPGLAKQLPNLTSLVLSNNQISDLGDLDALIGCKKLEFLSLLENPVMSKKHYRLYIIHKLPSIRVLDFRHVSDKERKESASTFAGTKGAALASSLSDQKTSANTFEPGEAPKRGARPYQGPTPEEADRIRAAINATTNLDEIERLSRALATGHVPSNLKDPVPDSGKVARDGDGNAVEMDED